MNPSGLDRLLEGDGSVEVRLAYRHDVSHFLIFRSYLKRIFRKNSCTAKRHLPRTGSTYPGLNPKIVQVLHASRRCKRTASYGIAFSAVTFAPIGREKSESFTCAE
jgi:hypothetical protein